MRLFDDGFDIFNDEVVSVTGTTEINYVNVDMNGSQGHHMTLEDILENETEIDVDLDIFENNDQADLDFNSKNISDLAYFGSVYAVVATAIENIKTNYPNGFSILQGTISTNTLGFDIDNTYLYGSGHAFPREETLNNFTVYEISESTGEIENTYAITGSTIGLTYGILYLDGPPLGDGYDYIVAPNKDLVNPFLAALSEYERTLLEPPYNKSNYWPRDAIVNSILICEGEPFNIFTSNEMNEAILSDNTETNYLWRKLYPQGQKMLDNDDGLMKRLILTYAASFDTIKKYQDHLAYAHTIDYSPVKHIPDDLVTLLANQWNWSLVKDLNQSDISEYIYPTFDNYVTGQSQQQLSGKDINFERWRRILANIVFLYKKKGTRAGLKFFANIYGIPERLFFIDEIVDRILLNSDLDPHHYVTSPSKIVVHTASGIKYINANTGMIKDYPYPEAFNTTYLSIAISPFAAIEFEFFDWGWSNHPEVINVNGDLVDFQTLNEPEEGEWFNLILQNLIPSDGTARYARNYPLLENEGKVYYANAATPWSMETLQPYIDFLDDNWATIAQNLIPSASKLLSWGTLYRNQFWNRQKFQWDARELDQRSLPIQKEVELDHLHPEAILETKSNCEIEVETLASDLIQKLTDETIITQIDSNVNIKSDSEVSILAESGNKLDQISATDNLYFEEVNSNTYSSVTPKISPISGSSFIGIGSDDLTTFSNELIVQTIDTSVELNVKAENLSNCGFSELKLSLFEKIEEEISVGEEIYSILNVIYEDELFGTYKLSSLDNILAGEFITIESAYVPYLNETVKIKSINTLTNEITTKPSIGLFHLPLGPNGSSINWLAYINENLLGNLFVAHENGNASYQSLINLLSILTVAEENGTELSNTEWNESVHNQVIFDPIYGADGIIQLPDHGQANMNRQIIVTMLEHFDEKPIEYMYASILLLEFLKVNLQYKLNDNPYVLIGNMLQNHTRATFKRVIGFFDWANPVQEIIINNDDYDITGGTGTNIGEWGDILPEIGTGTTVDQGDNILSGTSIIRFGGLSPLNNRILKDKCEYFYTLKASTTVPSGWTETVDGIDKFRNVNIIDNKIKNQVLENISYYGRNFTFFNRANEAQLVDAPKDVSTEFFAPLEMPAHPVAFHSFDGVGDADRLELQLYPISGATTYGNVEWDEYTLLNAGESILFARQGESGNTLVNEGGYDIYDAGVGRQDDITAGEVSDPNQRDLERSQRRLSWPNWLAAHGPSPDTFEEFSELYTANQIEEFLSGYYNTDGYRAHYDWMNYWDGHATADPLWDDWDAVKELYSINVPSGNIDHYRSAIAIDPLEIENYNELNETMWRNAAIIKTIPIHEYATDGYLYQIETILDAYQAYWWRIMNFRNTDTLFGHNLEIFTSTIPQVLVTGPDGHGGGQPGGIPEEPSNPRPRDEDSESITLPGQ